MTFGNPAANSSSKLVRHRVEEGRRAEADQAETMRWRCLELEKTKPKGQRIDLLKLDF